MPAFWKRVLSVGRELDLEQASRGIVEAPAVPVDAEYAALGVIGPDGKRLTEFLTVEITEEQIAEVATIRRVMGSWVS